MDNKKLIKVMDYSIYLLKELNRLIDLKSTNVDKFLTKLGNINIDINHTVLLNLNKDIEVDEFINKLEKITEEMNDEIEKISIEVEEYKIDELTGTVEFKNPNTLNIAKDIWLGTKEENQNQNQDLEIENAILEGKNKIMFIDGSCLTSTSSTENIGLATINPSSLLNVFSPINRNTYFGCICCSSIYECCSICASK